MAGLILGLTILLILLYALGLSNTVYGNALALFLLALSIGNNIIREIKER